MTRQEQKEKEFIFQAADTSLCFVWGSCQTGSGACSTHARACVHPLTEVRTTPPMEPKSSAFLPRPSPRTRCPGALVITPRPLCPPPSFRAAWAGLERGCAGWSGAWAGPERAARGWAGLCGLERDLRGAARAGAGLRGRRRPGRGGGRVLNLRVSSPLWKITSSLQKGQGEPWGFQGHAETAVYVYIHFSFSIFF